VALVPLLVALVHASRGPRDGWWGSGALLGLLTGFVYFAGTLYWTADVMVIFGGLPRVLAVPVAGLLAAFLALYPAVAAAITSSALRAWGDRGLWVFPAAWVGVELARAHLFTGFPWVLLGYSQVTVLPVAQVVSLGGVYALSALVASTSVALAGLATWRARREAAVAALAVAIAIAGSSVWGRARMAADELTRTGAPLRVGLVQGNIEQEKKWDPAYGSEILASYVTLSRLSAERGARLVVWPESATPFFFEEEPAGARVIRELAGETGVWLLFGSDQVERGTPPHYYNSAFLLSPDGRTAATYRKMQLVPFGEYVPLRQVLFFASPLVEGVAGFAPGLEMVVLPMDEVPISTAICYEIVFPHLTREAVLAGSQLLSTITNDGWYGWSSAPHQHFEQAAMRAIEQGRYLVRAANTGITGIVDPYGRVVARTALFETTTVEGDVRLLDGLTVYGRIGDSFAWAMAALSLLALFSSSATLARRRRGRLARR
jgi:apolipoprotein N-acyltransferase